jgi:hypothetical protein
MKHFILAALLLAPAAAAEKFYADDPLPAEPRPQNVENIKPRKINEYYDFFQNLMFRPGELESKAGVMVPARAVNTLGEVPDSEWYTNRHYRRRMKMDELERGPGNTNPPSVAGGWRVISAKTEGITPGFTIEDAEGRRYLLKFDPPSNPEMASAADVISSKFLYALGYNVPENYIVRFRPEQLTIDAKSTWTDNYGKRRRMTRYDLQEILARVKPDQQGVIRALASRFIPGTPIGPFRYNGTRSDDPNDTVPHEHRRDLRGLRVFAAWLGHDDSKSLNTLDTVVRQGDTQFVRHYLIDFGATLGSASFMANSPRSGSEYLFAWGPAARQFITLGAWVPKWATAKYPDIPSAGAFEYAVFDPERWVPEYPNSAFSNMNADDAFWAAKQITNFTDAEIRAIVRTGEYSDARAEEWVIKCLIERRNKIGRAFLNRVLPVDRFEVRAGRLEFEDLGATHFDLEQAYSVRWYVFDNQTRDRKLIRAANTFAIPAVEAEYLAAEITGERPGEMTTVYIRHDREIVGREVGPAANLLLTRR